MTRTRENYRLKLYQSISKDWHWRMTSARNGRIVGASSEGYARRIDCLENLRTVTGWEPDEMP